MLLSSNAPAVRSSFTGRFHDAPHDRISIAATPPVQDAKDEEGAIRHLPSTGPKRKRQAAPVSATVFFAPTDSTPKEFATLLDGDEAAVFLLFADGKAAGFAHCQLRHDYVEGTDSSPVGYLEGIYVEEALRRRGHARALLAACETWAAGRGCTEFASDCELGNEASRAFHLHAGFDEANRIVCFAKRL